jgi:outer membrane protein OmpA-like peptidoglycan-associated protein
MKKTYQTLLKCLALAVLVSVPVAFYGQDQEKDETDKDKTETVKALSTFSPYWYIKASVGAAFDHSDLNKNAMLPDFNNTQFGGQLGFGRQLNSIIGFGGYFNRGFLKASDKDKFPFDYESDYLEFAFRAPINFSNLIGGTKDRKFNIWGSIGFGQMQYKSNVSLRATGTELATYGYSDSPGDDKGKGLADRKVVAIIPVGLGFSYAIADKWDLNLDYTLKFEDTDMIDGTVSGAKAIKQDMYSFTGIGVTYKIGAGPSLGKMQKDFGLVELTTTPDVLVEKGNMVEVTIKGKVPPKYFNSKAAMLFQPVLKYKNGGEYALKPMTLKGEDVVGEGTIINSKNGGTFTYTDSFPYEEGMEAAELVVTPVAYIAKETIHADRESITLNEKFAEFAQRKLADGVIYTSERICPGKASVIAGHHGYEKETIVTESAKIFYRVNLSNLNWRLPLNKEQSTLDNLENVWAFVEKGWDIKNVVIGGWASPEGEETFNENLSENRAKTAHNYMVKKFKRLSKKKDATIDYKNPNDQINFVLKHHGPDWAGFMSSIENSTIQDKNVILNVVRSAGTQAKKEQEIRNMILIYPEIEDDYLQPLRRAELTVNCYEPKRTDVNIGDLATTYPDSLNVEELLYAATMTDDHGDKIQIYESVITVSPKNWAAYNNAAVAELEAGNVKEATAYLENAVKMAPNNAKIYNNLGVIALFAKDYTKAEEMFNKAESLGENAKYNLGLVEIHNGNYDKALKLMGGKNCDYNVGLAQLADMDYAKAENTLKCAKDKTAGTYYLLAVIGARTDNSASMFENLTKAIQMNAKYKAQAAEDREFIKFFDAPDFQALVQ